MRNQHVARAADMRLSTYTTLDLERIYCKIFERITGWKWVKFEAVGLNMRTAKQRHPHLYEKLSVVVKELNNRALNARSEEYT